MHFRNQMDQLIGAVGKIRFKPDDKNYNKLQDIPRESTDDLPPH